MFPAAEDEEDTIEAQEALEGDANHEEELDDLAKEGNIFFFSFVDHTNNLVIFVQLLWTSVTTDLLHLEMTLLNANNY